MNSQEAPRHDEPAPDEQGLLELAEWTLAKLADAADYAQVYASRSLTVHSEAYDGQTLATGLEPMTGVGCLVRQGARWRYRHVTPSSLGRLASWLDASASPSTGDAPADALLRGPRPLGHVPTPAGQWPAPDPRTEYSLLVMEDFTARAFAVADTDGVRAACADRVLRQRVKATVTVGGHPYRGMNRRVLRGAAIAEAARGTEDLVRVALDHALDASVATLAGPRRTPVVFGPSAGAGFLHELVGHALEGDNFALGSPYTTRLRRPGVLPPALTVEDDPTLPDGYGSYAIDDEGTPARTTPLLSGGDIGAPLASVRTVHRSGDAPTGNGRRRSYRDLAIPRASNTVVRPGGDRAAELLAVGPQGLLYVGCLGAGMINLMTGEYSFSALDCTFLTPDGHRVPVRDVSLFGDALDALERVEGIGADVGGDSVSCGKQGQMIGIGIYSPTMRFAALDWSAG
ncbi:TldD/PmbA family protein [Streptomyces sp. NPDC058955]|uniref:TldD/PmbA family protein n=1 Tax=unclassified Streptomyces TaxID=2593676 RepID=UPI003657F5A8